MGTRAPGAESPAQGQAAGSPLNLSSPLTPPSAVLCVPVPQGRGQLSNQVLNPDKRWVGFTASQTTRPPGSGPQTQVSSRHLTRPRPFTYTAWPAHPSGLGPVGEGPSHRGAPWGRFLLLSVLLAVDEEACGLHCWTSPGEHQPRAMPRAAEPRGGPAPSTQPPAPASAVAAMDAAAAPVSPLLSPRAPPCSKAGRESTPGRGSAAGTGLGLTLGPRPLGVHFWTPAQRHGAPIMHGSSVCHAPARRLRLPRGHPAAPRALPRPCCQLTGSAGRGSLSGPQANLHSCCTHSCGGEGVFPLKHRPALGTHSVEPTTALLRRSVAWPWAPPCTHTPTLPVTRGCCWPLSPVSTSQTPHGRGVPTPANVCWVSVGAGKERSHRDRGTNGPTRGLSWAKLVCERHRVWNSGFSGTRGRSEAQPAVPPPPGALTHVHHVADLVVAQRQHLQLGQRVQRVDLGDPVVEQAQVLQVHQRVQPLDGLNVVEGQVWRTALG